MSFVKIGRKLINLDHVKSVQPTKKAYSDGVTSEGVAVHYADGSDEYFNNAADVGDYLEKFTAPVIAAAPGFYLLDLYYQDEPPNVEIIKEVIMREREPIVAWRLRSDFVEPITLQWMIEWNDQRYAILYPDGQVVRPGENLWKNIDAAAAKIQERLLERCAKEAIVPVASIEDIEAADENEVMRLLKQATIKGECVSTNHFAPRSYMRFSKKGHFKGHSDRLEDAVKRLLGKGKIEIVDDGPPSKRKHLLQIVEPVLSERE